MPSCHVCILAAVNSSKLKFNRPSCRLFQELHSKRQRRKFLFFCWYVFVLTPTKQIGGSLNSGAWESKSCRKDWFTTFQRYARRNCCRERRRSRLFFPLPLALSLLFFQASNYNILAYGKWRPLQLVADRWDLRSLYRTQECGAQITRDTYFLVACYLETNKRQFGFTTSTKRH